MSIWSSTVNIPIVYPEDSLLRYRATVLDSSLAPKIKVQFVDYGTEAFVHQDFLRRRLAFQEVPALAFPVRLNVKPKCGSKWEDRELDFIHETAVDKLGDFEVLQPSQESWLVRLDLPRLTDVGHFLVQNGFCSEGEKFVVILKSLHHLSRYY